MSGIVTELWEGLRKAGIPEVMLYLSDGSASRCHWEDTAVLGSIRVALLADQERNIVRIVPIESAVAIGVPSPKGVDSVGFRAVVQKKLRDRPADDVVLDVSVGGIPSNLAAVVARH
jgi:hypothetical protein